MLGLLVPRFAQWQWSIVVVATVHRAVRSGDVGGAAPAVVLVGVVVAVVVVNVLIVFTCEGIAGSTTYIKIEGFQKELGNKIK